MNTLQKNRWKAWAIDAAERATKTFVQVGSAFLVGELAAASAVIEDSPAEVLPTELVIAAPIVVTALSVVTSWLSKFVGNPNDASAV